MAYDDENVILLFPVYEAQCAPLRLKRKTELVQAKKKRQEPVSRVQIESLLDEEFAVYQKMTDEQIGKMSDTLRRSQGKFLSEEETKELKKRYRRVIKALHPDLHPELTQAQMDLFHHAVDAYENGDLHTMRIISEMISESTTAGDGLHAAEQPVQEKKRLTSLLESIKEDIQKMKSDYPYTMKELLHDSKKIEERKQELRKGLLPYQEQADFYSAKIQEMMG